MEKFNVNLNPIYIESNNLTKKLLREWRLMSDDEIAECTSKIAYYSSCLLYELIILENKFDDLEKRLHCFEKSVLFSSSNLR